VKVAAAIVVIAVTLSAALYVHLRRIAPNDHMTFFNARTAPEPKIELRNLGVGIPTKKVHPSWEDPVAILLSAGGIVTATGILTVRRRPATKAT
jgi:hypothetical protein